MPGCKTPARSPAGAAWAFSWLGGQSLGIIGEFMGISVDLMGFHGNFSISNGISWEF